jgi:hypothetical protein
VRYGYDSRRTRQVTKKNAWDDMERAKEDQYFDRQNQEALRALHRTGPSGPRLSPVTGKPMETIMISDIPAERCVDTGGIWLDKGELEEILKRQGKSGAGGALQSFFEGIFAPQTPKK